MPLNTPKLLFAFLLFAGCIAQNALWAQEATLLKGTILDIESKEPLIGATVLIKGTNSGTSTDNKGNFELKTNQVPPYTLVVTLLGYQAQEYTISGSDRDLKFNLSSQTVLGNEVVVSASRVSENLLESPVSIEKLDLVAIKETPAPTFFDALENVKGVQFTTLSLGFKVPNTRGFSGTTNSRFLQLVDGADVTSPGIGAPIANTVGPTELDIVSIELIPGAASAIYGMNAINGISSLTTKDPFLYEGLSIYQRTGVNHVDGNDADPHVLTETAVRYAKSFKDKFAFKINASYMKGYDWVADNQRDLNRDANTSVGLIGEDNPSKDPINSYGTESQNRTTLSLKGKSYQVARTGYAEKEFIDYNVENLKGDVTLAYKINDKNQLSYTYRLGTADNMYQRGNRIKLDNVLIQQHKLEWTSNNFTFRTYYTQESTGDSYNARPMAENLDRNFKSDKDWYAQYKSVFEAAVDNGVTVTDAHSLARTTADSGRYQPGTKLFEDKVKELSKINNWDHGAALILKTRFVHGEAQYNWGRFIKFADVLTGVDFRDYIITPDGNSFINPESFSDSSKADQNLQYYKVGGFIQVTKKLFGDRFKIVASARVDKQQYFAPKVNPRIALVYTLKKNHNFRVSYQNGFRFPTLFEGFSYVDNGGIKRVGGIRFLSENLQIVENSYLRSSQDAFQKAVRNDINANGLTEGAAIEKHKGLLVKNNYGYIKPEHINSFEVGYKAVLFNSKVFVDADYYLNVYKDFIGQIEVTKPNAGIIGVDDSTVYHTYQSGKFKRYRIWTNSHGILTNHGASIGVTYNFYKKFTLGGNFSYAELLQVSQDDALAPTFNTPKYTVNLSIGNREVVKNLGFNITWRWQAGFEYESQLATGVIPAYNTLDAQINYRVPKIKATFKIGASNLLNQRYYQYEGGPTIGGFYYTTISFDGLFN